MPGIPLIFHIRSFSFDVAVYGPLPCGFTGDLPFSIDRSYKSFLTAKGKIYLADYIITLYRANVIGS